ncbi:MAG: mechanosensitive ion channel family protein [Candidatus Altiarchaeota archaeon]|nr:mechanosensitive ion channel family protein [Candidatus Altiarchaeota archaeon]
MIDFAGIMSSQVVINILKGILTFFIGIIIVKRLESLFERAFRKKMPKGMAKSVSRLTYYIMIFILALISLDAAGFKIESLLLAGGVLGIAVGFASQTTVSNLISGLFLYIDRPFDIGDSVEMGKVSGIVQDITPLSTRVRTWEGPIVRIPNESVFNSEIKNFKKVAVRRFSYTIGIGYGSDVDKAMKIIKDVIKEEPFILTKPGPTVYLANLADSALEISVKAWTPENKNFSVKISVLQKLYSALTKAKIEIPFPKMDVYLKK